MEVFFGHVIDRAFETSIPTKTGVLFKTNLLAIGGDPYTPVLARCGLMALATVRDLTNRNLGCDALANVRFLGP
jgi:hypothetical protein